MAVTLEGGCRVSEMHEGEPVVNGSVRIWNQIGKASGAQAISLRVMEFARVCHREFAMAIAMRFCMYSLLTLKAPNTIAGASAKRVALGQVSSQSPHPEGVRDDNQQIKLILDDKSFHVTAETGVYIRRMKRLQSIIQPRIEWS
jgi:hypothetical protein